MFVDVEVIAIRVGCNLCGATARIANHDDAHQRATRPGSAWMAAHLRPEIRGAEVVHAGVRRVVPVVGG